MAKLSKLLFKTVRNHTQKQKKKKIRTQTIAHGKASWRSFKLQVSNNIPGQVKKEFKIFK